MRVLIVNPEVPRLHSLGACEQDRLVNAADLQRYGYEVRLLTRANPHNSIPENEQFYAKHGVQATVTAFSPPSRAPYRFGDVANIDGAAWVYGMPDFRTATDAVLDEWKPDLVWCHTSFSWHPAFRAKLRGIPTVIRSTNYEPNQLVYETRRTAGQYVRYFGKLYSERRTLQGASVLAAITPFEASIYSRIAATIKSDTPVEVLPLRTLPALLRNPVPAREHAPLRVFMMGSSYNMSHNRVALEFIVRDLAPIMRERAPGAFEFHILGSKVPDELKRQFAAPDVIFDGYVEDLEAHLNTMDIALAPSLIGAGMQQKVFEPICRGFPTVTHTRALAGYALENGKHILTGNNLGEVAAALTSLRDPALRTRIAADGAARARDLFSQQVIDAKVNAIIDQAVKRK
jgi:glycosyltransferase involved in cell wall biosynthesis